jgi:alanine racemase
MGRRTGLRPRPPLRLLLDGEALVSNFRWLAAQSGAAECGAAVKADAYGLGAREVVKRLLAAGCRSFFVAHWGEAAAIADLVPPAQIAVFNGLDGDDPAEVLKIGALPVLNTPAQIARWKAAGGGLCHVMLDSGINRLGIGPEQMGQGLFGGLEIDLLMSHLASADEDGPQNAEQLQMFNSMAEGVQARRRSLANSAGIMLGADYHFDLTRPGLSLYGGYQRGEMAGRISTVARPQASVLQIRNVPAGSPVGYNAEHICEAETRIATLAIGYADGYRRGFSDKGMTRFEGVEMPVLGRVSMDLLIIDASAVPRLEEGDWVAVDFDLIEASRVSGVGQYELLTGLGSRAERVWS